MIETLEGFGSLGYQTLPTSTDALFNNNNNEFCITMC